MTRRLALRVGLAAACAAGVLAVAGCANTPTPSGPNPPTVSVSATGSAQAVPDAARATLSVSGRDKHSAQGAQAKAAQATTALLAALTAAGVDKADIATQAIDVGPRYRSTPDGTQKQAGYEASQTLVVTLKDLASAGATLDSAVASAGNAVSIQGVETYVSDPAKAANAARAQAVDIARRQADQYAQLLGFSIGPVDSVSESTDGGAPVPLAMADNAAGKQTTPISPGTTTVRVTVDIAWRIDE